MKVFMLGWEFPPFISGGLGTACYGLTKAMTQLDLKVTFVLPKLVDSKYATHVKLLNPRCLTDKSFAASYRFDELKNVTFMTIKSPLQPYSTPEIYQQKIEETLKQKRLAREGFTVKEDTSVTGTDYSGDMYTEVHRYAAMAARLALNEQFRYYSCPRLDDLSGGNRGGGNDRQAAGGARAFDGI